MTTWTKISPGVIALDGTPLQVKRTGVARYEVVDTTSRDQLSMVSFTTLGHAKAAAVEESNALEELGML